MFGPIMTMTQQKETKVSPWKKTEMAIVSKNNHKNRRQNIYSIPFQPGNGLMLCMIYLSVVTYDQQKFALDWLKAFSSTNHKKLL